MEPPQKQIIPRDSAAELSRKISTRNLEARPLTAADAPQLSAMLTRQSPAYCQYFTPFDYDETTIAVILARARLDIFWGFYLEEEIIGFSMLRGWDDGYEVPMLGIFIDEKFRGPLAFRLMAQTVDSGINVCRARGVRRIMYKAHPDNTPARSAKRLGFTQAGADQRTGHLIFHFDLSDSG